MFSELGPYRLPAAATHRVERASHRSGGRARGRRADAEVAEWVNGRGARGDAVRVARVFAHLKLKPVECQKRVSVGGIDTAVDLIAMPAAGGPLIAVELKTGFADRWEQKIGSSSFTPKKWAILQAAAGAVMLGLKRALVIRVLDYRVEYCWASAAAFAEARGMLARRPAPKGARSTSKRA